MPLLSAIIVGLFGNQLSNRISQFITVVPMVISAILSCVILYLFGFEGQQYTVELFTWFEIGDLKVDWSLRFDTLTAVMVLLLRLYQLWCIFIRSDICPMPLIFPGLCLT